MTRALFTVAGVMACVVFWPLAAGFILTAIAAGLRGFFSQPGWLIFCEVAAYAFFVVTSRDDE